MVWFRTAPSCRDKPMAKKITKTPARAQVPESKTYRTAMQAFHANAAALNRLSGKTQSELAEAIGVSRAFLHIFEHGGQKISLSAMCLLAEYHGVTIAQMLTPGAFTALVRHADPPSKATAKTVRQR